MAGKSSNRLKLFGSVILLMLFIRVAIVQKYSHITMRVERSELVVDMEQDINQGPALEERTEVKFVESHVELSNEGYTIDSKIKSNSLRCPQNERPKESEINQLRTVWQTHSYGKSFVYIYSAYYDDRPAVGFKPLIRIIAMATFDGNLPIYCHVWYDNIAEPYVVDAIVNETGINRYVFNKVAHREYTYSCELPISHPIPTHVSITKQDICNQTYSTYEPIYYVPRQEPPIDFGICVTNGYGYHPPHEIVEWIELHRLYGVQEFNLYDSNFVNMSEVFNHYIEKGILKVHSIPHPLGIEENWYQKMRNLRTTALNDCMMRNIYRYRYMVVLDLDEFIVPRQHLPYSQLLDKIDHRLNLTTHFHSYTFLNVYFFKEFEQFNNESLRVFRSRYRAKHNGEFFGSKSFVSPLCCFNLFNHYCWRLLPGYGKITAFVPSAVGASHHYRKCGFGNETCQRFYNDRTLDNVMLKIRTPLKDKMNPVLKQLGLNSNMIK